MEFFRLDISAAVFLFFNTGVIRIDLATFFVYNKLCSDPTEQELKEVIQEIAADKAPGPDGFIGAFYKASWEDIKEDLLATVNFFYSSHNQHFNLLNSAHIVLLPKKEDALKVGDFRPISLSHSITKLSFKLLAVTLSSDLDKLVSRAQSVFIKKKYS